METKSTSSKQRLAITPDAPAADRRSRHQLLFEREVAEQANTLCGEDRRSFNNLLEWLVVQEYKRRHPEAETLHAMSPPTPPQQQSHPRKPNELDHHRKKKAA